jgi:outer membrane lipoprotein
LKAKRRERRANPGNFLTLRKWITWLSIALCGLGSACTLPISKASLKSVDPEISFQAVRVDPEKYRGKVILVGGEILLAEVRPGESWLEVLERPLDRWQRPKETDESAGRFWVKFEGFLDPALYDQGKKITVLGEVEGERILPIGEVKYRYPVLRAKEHHLWRKIDPFAVPSFSIGIGIHGVIR